ncbi:MAG: hypothetical protein A2X49_08775 [Lentisphaerae bacterium GWF2_52_8]|nr:MAG: hypothetical protein A2X49_08775 [Lentisphaerae bacterium GWF2_52_8]
MALDKALGSSIAQHCGISENELVSYEIRQRSFDGRQRHNMHFVYRISAELREGASPKNAIPETSPCPAPEESPLHRLKPAPGTPLNPLVIGSGPAGLMAAYLLALHGRKPVVLERGRDVERRETDIASFLETRTLNPESNYLFGEGGAGAYSDGKLYTRTRDEAIRFVLDVFVAAGAPPQIRYINHPHIGSDLLPRMVKNIRNEIIRMGGTFHWDTQVTDMIADGSHCLGALLANGEKIEAPAVILAPGHSARSLMLKLASHGVKHSLKDFQIGCRIEHPQDFINSCQYGPEPWPRCLEAAEYQVVSRPPEHLNTPGVTSFCMCPGGEIMAASSDPGQLCTNGMSRFARSSPFANSALIVRQEASSFANAGTAFDFLTRIEKTSFVSGGSDYSAPAQRAQDFLAGRLSQKFPESSYKLGLKPARIDEMLPAKTSAALRAALGFFDRKMRGFISEGTFIGIETRVSSPLRFERNPTTLESSLSGLYIAGEGAGFASGIVSAALDGLRIAQSIITAQGR